MQCGLMLSHVGMTQRQQRRGCRGGCVAPRSYVEHGTPFTGMDSMLLFR